MQALANQQFPDPPEPYDEDEYRESIRTWFDAIPSDENEITTRAEWEYICSLAGVAPD
jgi:hypothetical protein